MFLKEDNGKVYTFLLSVYNKVSNETIHNSFSSQIEGVLSQERLALLLLLVDNEYAKASKEELKKVVQQIGVRLKSDALYARRERLKRLLEAAEARGDNTAIQQYMQEFRTIE